MSDTDTRFDGVSGCKTCDRVNVSNAVHAVEQLIACDVNDVDSKEEALELICDQLEEANP